jgi:hypothetical protein
VKTAVLLGGAVILLLAMGAYQLFRERGEKLDHLSAANPRFATGAEPIEAMTEFERRSGPDVYYHVTLREVPLGGRLTLNCEWIDPAGHIARRNRYRTRFVYKATWPTHCHQRFSDQSVAGSWHVRLTMNGRVLSDSSFALR